MAAGFDLRLELAPLADPAAAAAARLLLDPEYARSTAAFGPSAAVLAWRDRLERWNKSGDPVEIARQAGQSASLIHRPGTVFLQGEIDDLKLASAGETSQAPYFLSGYPVNLLMAPAHADLGGSWRESAFIVHSGDTHRFARLLQNVRDSRPEKADLILVDLTEGVGIGAWEDEEIPYVAPIQALLDSFGGGALLAQAAERIARSW